MSAINVKKIKGTYTVPIVEVATIIEEVQRYLCGYIIV